MKRIPATLLWVSSLLLFLPAASCTDTLVGRPDTDDRTITFQTPQADTRAAVTGTSLTSGSFLVWGGYGGNATNVFDAVTVTGDNGVWTYEGTRYWKAGETYNFYAVYPAELPAGAVADVSPEGTVTVTGFDCSATGEAAVDLMTATKIGMEGSQPEMVSMKFGHELARVKVSVESNGATVDGLKVYGVGYKGNFNSTGTLSKWAVTQTAGENTTPLSGAAPLDMLLLPATNLTDAKLKVTYHYGNEASATRTDEVSLAIEGGWTAGQQYHYKVSIVAGKLTITVTVVDWTEMDTSVSWG